MLGILSEHRDGMTLAELARASGVPASSLLSILGSLRDAKAVRVLSTKRYVLDVGLFQLGQTYWDGVDMMTQFYWAGKRLVAEFNETVQLGVLSGGEAVYIARQESTHPVRLVAKVGRRVPAHASALGKSLLAGLAADDLRALLGPEPLPSSTAQTITTYDRLLAELSAVRSKGFSESKEECAEGIHCLAAPVFGDGGTVAALSVSTPIFRMDGVKRRRLIAGLRAAAEELSQEQLGGRWADPSPAVALSPGSN